MDASTTDALGRTPDRRRVWQWAERADLVGRYCSRRWRRGPEASAWALICHAARVSAAADQPPPRAGYPTASPGAWLTADDETWWQRVAAYLRGEVDEIEAPRARWTPDPIEITLRDEVLAVWHQHALGGPDGHRRLRAAVYALACGQPVPAVRRTSGLTRGQLRHARDQAVEDFLAAW